ncbi:serine hydrolase domain-containing protein [Sphaerisporangium fuscum]|uniref:serine hydrolase domain-containing protein n=1 Tax=Sphaerisporangium fuscum TaxID=2835868 RepID=UPI0020299F49|nr:serine hydrolase domain-containing protein [Sphaerisporangium fuscum]
MKGSATAASGLRKAYKDKIALENRLRMRAFRGVGVTALAAALLAGAAAPVLAIADSRPAPKATAGQDRPELQKAIQEWVDDGYAGMQMRVHDQRGDWVGSAGVRKLGQSATPPTNGRFWIGSATKSFTATLVLQLVAEGKVELDGPVADYLPELGLDRRITVRMMLQHTSGLFNYTGEYYDDGKYVPGIPATGKEWLDNRFRTYQPEELVRLALSKPAKFAPGTGWSYANTNYTLALLLIEKVTGHSYTEEMKRRILRPLGLSDTMVPGTRTDLPGPHSHGYFRYQDADQWKVVDVTRQNLSLLAGAGDMISTTKDLQTFFSALNGGKLLPARLLAEMRRPDPRSDGLFGRYGLGTYVLDTGPDCAGVILNHDGSPPAGYGTLMYSTPDGSKTLTASITMGDAAIDQAVVFPKALNRLIKEVFCDGQAGAEKTRPAQ